MLKLLNMKGLRALKATNGRKALGMLYKKHVDTLFLDLKMSVMSRPSHGELIDRLQRPEAIIISARASLDLPVGTVRR